MNRNSYFLVICALILARTSHGADSARAVSVELTPPAIVIKNQSPRTICYAIHEQHLLTLIEWGPVCEQNNQIGPRKSIQVPLEKHNFNPSGKAEVAWWFHGDNVVQGYFNLTISTAAQQGDQLDAGTGRKLTP
jgi:hypothetical protein